MKPETLHKLRYASANGGARLNVDEAQEILAELERVATPSPVKVVAEYATKHVRAPGFRKRRTVQ